MMDLDDAKYDRKLKRSLLSRRRKARTTRRSIVSILLLLVIGSLMLLYVAIQHRHHALMKSQYHQLQRAREMRKTHHNKSKKPQPHHHHYHQTSPHPAALFATLRSQQLQDDAQDLSLLLRPVLDQWLQEQDTCIVENTILPTPAWIQPYLLPPLPTSSLEAEEEEEEDDKPQSKAQKRRTELRQVDFFRVMRSSTSMAWEQEAQDEEVGPAVDYTDDTLYTYPEIQPYAEDDESYPPLQSLASLMEQWPQDQDYDTSSSSLIQESLYHFNFSNPDEMVMAEHFRDAELPFKLYDIPELEAATEKWTDEYLTQMFAKPRHHKLQGGGRSAEGNAQESRTNFFAFFTPHQWKIDQYGLPPTRNNDWSYATWAQHARYADAVRLPPGAPHFYWQAGVPAEERYADPSEWTFVTRDLRLLSATEDDNFVVFHPESQKGIQCRFGERGVVAATHYDGGRNMVAMITGAKRYVLSPPNQCSRLGIFTQRKSPIYRHSLLNFGHLQNLHEDTEMSTEERAWLERAASSQALETVLKAGEILYIPSHWFHYIVSLQKSAQCNVRSGIHHEGNPRFGGRDTVIECQDP